MRGKGRKIHTETYTGPARSRAEKLEYCCWWLRNTAPNGPGPSKPEPDFAASYHYFEPTPKMLENDKASRKKALVRRRARRRAGWAERDEDEF